MNYTSIPGIAKRVEKMTDEQYIAELIFLLCQKYHITRQEFESKSRKREYVEPRQIFSMLAVLNTNYTLGQLGKLIGGKDHATVLHGRRTAENLYETDMKFKKLVQEIEALLENKVVHSPDERKDITVRHIKDLERWKQAQVIRAL